MAAKPREPAPEEQKELDKLRDKLERKGVVKPHQPKHRPKGK